LEILGGISNSLLSAAIPSVIFEASEDFRPFPHLKQTLRKYIKTVNMEDYAWILTDDISFGRGTGGESGNCGKTERPVGLGIMR